jgi:hypothetical protein
MLTEEMLDEIGARLKHSPRKFLARLSQQAQVLKTAAWRATKNLHLRPYEITQVQVTEECDYGRRTHICNWFLQAVHDGVLDPKLTFFTDEAWFHQSGYNDAQNNRYRSSINPRQTFEVPLHDQKIGVWCAITASRTVGPIFFKSLLIQSGMSLKFLGHFSEALRKKKRHIVILCKTVLQHTLPLIPLMLKTKCLKTD